MSALKPDGGSWSIAEQVVHDEVTGLTLQFDLRADGSPRLRIIGEQLPFGNRDIGFEVGGGQTDAGSATASCPAPSWIQGVVS